MSEQRQSGRRRATGSTRWVTLCYHAVDEGQTGGFRRQVRLLGSRVRAVGSIGSCVSRGGPAVVVTFDDGFACLLETAVPVLARRGMPAVIFAVAGNLGRPPAWEIQPKHPDATRRLLTTAELRALPDLITVGSHTWSHPRLDRLSPLRVRRELVTSKQALEDITGRPVNALAFPHGAYSEQVVRLAYECGYERLFTIEPCAHPGPLPFGLIGRVEVTADDWPAVFRLKVSTACNWLFRLRQAKRAILGRRRQERTLSREVQPVAHCAH